MLKNVKSSKFTKYGLPFLILVVGGSFGLKQFTSVRYEFFNRKVFVKEVEKGGIKIKPSSDVTLDKEFEKIEQLDTTNWENKRGPRPWEEDNQLYLDAIERAKEIEKKKAKQQVPLMT